MSAAFALSRNYRVSGKARLIQTIILQLLVTETH